MTGTQSLVGGNRTRIRDHSHMPADHESLAGSVERSNREKRIAPTTNVHDALGCV
jgi:hypothetical protein